MNHTIHKHYNDHRLFIINVEQKNSKFYGTRKRGPTRIKNLLDFTLSRYRYATAKWCEMYVY